MLFYLAIGVLIVLGIHFLVTDLEKKDKDAGKKGFAAGLVGAIVYLVARLGFLRVYNLIGGVLLLLPIIGAILKKGGFDIGGSGPGYPAPPAEGKMSIEEAARVLGVSEKATEEEIKKAHRDLIQKLHPDKGGNQYLATKINLAKEVLLKRLKP